ncbi:DUF1492 domain-containing protein [Streptococcus uberis]
MVKKEVTEAEKLLKELHNIPKIIEALKLDIERTRNSLIANPKWSDIRVVGGVRQTQEDKNLHIIDTSEYNRKEVERLVKRKEEIMSLIHSLDPEQSLLLITAYCNCQYPTEAMEKLGWGKDRFYRTKKAAIENLNILLRKEDM